MWVAVSGMLVWSMAAQAENCRVTPQASGELHIVVGGKNKCFESAAARKAFGDNLKVAVAEMTPSPAAGRHRKGTIRRSAAGDKLYNIADLQHQAKTLTAPAPVYYGQK